MSGNVSALLGSVGWLTVFGPLALLWWLPDHRRSQALKEASRRRERRSARCTPGRSS